MLGRKIIAAHDKLADRFAARVKREVPYSDEEKAELVVELNSYYEMYKEFNVNMLNLLGTVKERLPVTMNSVQPGL